MAELQVVESLDETVRGANGFGSTGYNKDPASETVAEVGEPAEKKRKESEN